MSIPLFLTQIEKTTAEWDTENPVLGENVIGIEIMSNGFNRFKRGNGIDHWRLLPYIDKIPPVNITAAMLDVYTKTETDDLLNDKFGSADVIPVSNGGTGRSTLTSGYFLRGNGTSAVTMSSAASARNAMGLGNTTGALPVANGGTGATTKNAAANNLCEVGTWTPTFECYNDSGNTTTAPTVTIGWRDAYYIRFGDFCYLYMGAAIGISNIGGGYAQIGGLPFEAYPLGYQGGICNYVYQCLTNSSNTEPVRAVVGSNAPSKVRLRNVNNVGPYKWKVNTSVGTNAGRVYFAFMYRIKS